MKKWYDDVLRGPGIVPVAFVSGIASPLTFEFLYPVAFATNANTLLNVLLVSPLPKLPNPQFASTVLNVE